MCTNFCEGKLQYAQHVEIRSIINFLYQLVKVFHWCIVLKWVEYTSSWVANIFSANQEFIRYV